MVPSEKKKDTNSTKKDTGTNEDDGFEAETEGNIILINSDSDDDIEMNKVNDKTSFSRP